ncbi:hypothetical protein B0T24DRAFT_659317 [Lasiosphaeria ovina]|uniref:Uncharacterized protein n=1 Tax=Lasiosphaeria ovina TaxID=92902 RepID=A0AAE0N1I8_9PEZI|nr:hypothetical protein B0T24DRAFT_659317 [Lasiosphaeria ovina]
MLIRTIVVLTLITGTTPVAKGAVPGGRIHPPPEYLTIAIINYRSGPVSTSHASNIGAPTPIWGDSTSGTIPSGGAAALVVPTGWAGNVAIFDAPIPGATAAPATDSSLIEANGFSGPITCACSGVVVTGCNIQLWGLNACPKDNGGACVNPLRADKTATTAVPFFAPCQGAAYTFRDCPPNPKQPLNPRGG